MSGLCWTCQEDEGMGKSKAAAVCVCMCALMGDTSFDPLLFCFEFQSIPVSIWKAFIFYFFIFCQGPRTQVLIWYMLSKSGWWLWWWCLLAVSVPPGAAHWQQGGCETLLASGSFGRYWRCRQVQIFWPLDRVAHTCCQNIEIWQRTSCKIGSCPTVNDWWEQLIYGKMNEVVGRWMLG